MAGVAGAFAERRVNGKQDSPAQSSDGCCCAILNSSGSVRVAESTAQDFSSRRQVKARRSVLDAASYPICARLIGCGPGVTRTGAQAKADKQRRNSIVGPNRLAKLRRSPEMSGNVQAADGRGEMRRRKEAKGRGRDQQQASCTTSWRVASI